MNHHDHVNLLKNGIPQPGGVWADFGSGSGAFTLALRELVGTDAEIYSIDKDAGALREQERAFSQMFPHSHVHFIHADFTHALNLPPLDGAVMANALHYFQNDTPSRLLRNGMSKETVLRHIREYLKPNGVFLLVEYNVDYGNMWVPHPLSFETFRTLAPRAGFSEPRLLATVPSRFLHEFYSAAAHRI
ncbi:MAG TPA: class I SAM-dependent methyltransferase [Anaerolineae bacterium]|nr:class I SAM-dependent methyltransferase [Anaerolineae bacterium]